MLKVIFLSLFLTLALFCFSQTKPATLQYQKLGSTFLLNLYNKEYNKCETDMDDLVKEVFKKRNINLTETLIALSDKIKKDYGGIIKSNLLSSEKTIHENLPSTFLIFKVESATKFGYYYFYINEKTNKILLVSEFSTKLQKR